MGTEESSVHSSIYIQKISTHIWLLKLKHLHVLGISIFILFGGTVYLNVFCALMLGSIIGMPGHQW